MTRARRDVFQAIADPTRREILSLLAGEPMNVGSLAARFDISRPAISQQVRVLAECGLVEIRRAGRERYCEPRFDRLDEVAEWAEPLRRLWASRFKQLDDLLDEYRTESKKNSK